MTARVLLGDGGIETDLIFHHGQDLPHFAAFVLLDTAAGRQALQDYYLPYLQIARGAGLGLVLETPTWRASPDWIDLLGRAASDVDRVNRSAVHLLHGLRDTVDPVSRDTSTGGPVVISGCIGPRHDGFDADQAMSVEQAHRYHGAQVGALAAAGADRITAMTLAYPAEASGIVLAARDLGTPVVISFTVEVDGHLPDGSLLAQAIQDVDAVSEGYAESFMVNCAHPDHVAAALAVAGDGSWRSRLSGVRANASTRSHAELDVADDLDEGDPTAFGEQLVALRDVVPTLRVLGGCCGTDHRHIRAVADALVGPAEPRALMTGAPPAATHQVTLANWQEPPFNRWSFQHVREVVPTHRIRCAPGTARALTVHLQNNLADLPVADDTSATLATVLADTYTDAAIILHDGVVVFEHYSTTMQEDTPHLLMSVSKSLVGCVAGVLVDQGLLDLMRPAEHYVPELAGSGYAGARVRDVLDMRTGVHFGEDYADLDSEVRVMEEHAGWRPARQQPPLGLYAYLATLHSDGPHGAGFTYRSADTDVLGWICERASGHRMADLVSTHLWRPMGAEFDAELTCDPLGSGVHDGGICACARDLARFGQLLLDDGRLDGAQVIATDWLSTALAPGPGLRASFAASPSEDLLPGGWYSTKFWFVPGPDDEPVQMCRGIHGQLIMVDRQTRTVAVKLSTWPDADDDRRFIDTLNAFSATSRHLAGLPPRRWL